MDSQYIPNKEDEKLLTETLSYLKGNLEGFELVDVGSTAKGTWLRGHSDIDIYIISEDKDKAYEKVKKLWPHGHDKKGQLTIWNFEYNGFDIDLVLVDRGWHKREDTVAHADFFNARLTPEMKNEVRKAKAYFKTKGVYGAENGGIVGVAIETLIILCKDLETLCKKIVTQRPTIQDPTMTSPRDLLASINGRRWTQLRKACQAYIDGEPWTYRVMTTEEFMADYPHHCTLMFHRKYDKGLDYQTITSNATKVSRMMRNTEPEVTADIDAYVDSERIVLCFRVRPLELSKTRTVCIDPHKLSYKDLTAFRTAHPITYQMSGMMCTEVERKIRFPDTYFTIEVARRMEEKGYRRY